MNNEFVVTAAGGNATAIRVIDVLQDRTWYESQSQDLMQRTAKFDTEQVGFLHLNSRHFEMGGGEFCGNAARAAAQLIARLTGEMEFTFTMSGFSGPVEAEVTDAQGDQARVMCRFPNLDTTVQKRTLKDGAEVDFVDLGGIVHVLIEAPFPETKYELQHRQVMEDLGLLQRAAVGVNWIQEDEDGLTLHPVVWVRSIDTFYYETACGSGSIAASACTGHTTIIQPSGKSIEVEITNTGTRLKSLMEVIHVA